MAEELKVVVSADTSQLTAGVNKAAQSLATLRQSSAQAGTAVGNMSRVVQDAPFGFMAISNNLQPLFDDFTRLRNETGSVGGAMRALGGTLMGPAGIGFAFAAITSVITIFTMNMGKAKKETEDMEKDAKAFADSMNNAKTSATATAVQLQAYIDIARNGQLPLEQRNEALKNANKLFGEHGEKLTLVNINSEKTTAQINLMTKALMAEAVAAQYANRIAELTVKNSILTAQAQKDQQNITKESNKIVAQGKTGFFGMGKEVKFLIGSMLGASGASSVFTDDLQSANNALSSTNQQIALNTQEINTLTLALDNSTKQATAAYGTLGTKSDETTKKLKKNKEKDIETVDEFYAKYKENIADLARVEAATSESKLPEKLKTTVSALEGIISQFNLDPDNKFVIAIKSDLFRLQLQETFSKPLKLPPIQMALAVDPKKFTPILSDTYKKATKVLQKENEGLQKQMQANADSINNILKGTFEGIASSVAEGFANLMMGGNVADFFKGIFGTIAEGMIQLGKQFIQMAIQISIVKKFLLKNPALAIAGGVALIAIGSVLKSLMGKKSAFATGTTFAPGGLALVGERGPELIGLPRGSQVIPATQTANMMGAMESVQVYGVLRGQDIYFSNKKYGQTYNRTA